MSNIYGVDTESEVTPLMVREAIINCFSEAHCIQSGIQGSGREIAKQHCVGTIKRAFAETGGDFENPTRESLTGVVTWLADFSRMYRDQATIQKHRGEIMQLIMILKDGEPQG
jgi:hypothetical protein